MERFFKGGMRPHGSQQLLYCQVVCYSLRKLRDHVGTPLTHQLCANQLVIVGTGYQLDEAAVTVIDHGAGVAEHDGFSRLDGQAQILSFLFSDTHNSNFRTAIDASGNNGDIH